MYDSTNEQGKFDVIFFDNSTIHLLYVHVGLGSNNTILILFVVSRKHNIKNHIKKLSELMGLRDLSNRDIILIVSGVSFIIIIVLLGLSFFAFTSPKYTGPIQDSIMGTLLAIMSLIIMLGVAFSFVSIFDAKEDIQRLTDLVNQNRDTKQQVKDMLEELKENKLNSKIALAKCEIYSLDMAATSFYHERNYPQAIKKEYEVLGYIIRNQDDCEAISVSYWGMKRYAISNDIRMFLLMIADMGFPKFALGELDDIMATIFGIISNLESCKDFSKICQGEADRYNSLMYWTKNIISNLNRGELDFPIDYEAYKKLYIYTKIYNGHKDDSQVNIDAKTELALKKEFAEFEKRKKAEFEKRKKEVSKKYESEEQ